MHMNTKKSLKPLLIAIGAGVAISLSSIPIANAASNSNNFQTDKLSSGYKLAGSNGGDKAKDGKCGAGKCGAQKQGKAKDGKCGAGKCGADKKK